MKHLLFSRDQHADDVKEDFEERPESEMRTSHEARGSNNNLIFLMTIYYYSTIKTNWNMAVTFILKMNFICLVCSIVTGNKSLLLRIKLVCKFIVIGIYLWPILTVSFTDLYNIVCKVWVRHCIWSSSYIGFGIVDVTCFTYFKLISMYIEIQVKLMWS